MVLPKSEMTKAELHKLKTTMAIRFALLPLLVGVLVLVPAGTWNYWQLYLYVAVLTLPMVFVLFYFLKNDPRFLDRRTHSKEKEKEQRPIVLLTTALFLLSWIVPGLDKRFSWSQVPIELVLLANGINLLGYSIVFLSFRQNSFASRIVEIDANQQVISTGLYGIVRHPMYLGILLMFLPMPLALGSYWGLLPAAFLPLAMVRRIITEERLLKTGLKGYMDYCQRVRKRLIPFVW